MYEKLRELYLDGRLSDVGLDNAVARGWITQAQADQIRADKAALAADEEIVNQLIIDALEV